MNLRVLPSAKLNIVQTNRFVNEVLEDKEKMAMIHRMISVGLEFFALNDFDLNLYFGNSETVLSKELIECRINDFRAVFGDDCIQEDEDFTLGDMEFCACYVQKEKRAEIMINIEDRELFDKFLVFLAMSMGEVIADQYENMFNIDDDRAQIVLSGLSTYVATKLYHCIEPNVVAVLEGILGSGTFMDAVVGTVKDPKESINQYDDMDSAVYDLTWKVFQISSGVSAISGGMVIDESKIKDYAPISVLVDLEKKLATYFSDLIENKENQRSEYNGCLLQMRMAKSFFQYALENGKMISYK